MATNQATSDVSTNIERILGELGLRAAVERFKAEKIDENVAATLSDNELIRLRVATISDRARFRQLCRKYCGTGPDSVAQIEGSEGSSSGLQVSRSAALREQALLFNS